MDTNEYIEDINNLGRRKVIGVEYLFKYYAAVKEQLQDNQGLWRQFLKVIQIMRSNSFNPMDVHLRILEIFRDYPDLHAGFEAFLPQSFKEYFCESHKNGYMLQNGRVRTSVRRPIFIPSACSELIPPSLPDDSVSCIGRYSKYADLVFFDKVKKAFGHPEVYNNFLQCLQLYVDDEVTQSELVQTVLPFFCKFPELFKEFKTTLHLDEGVYECISSQVAYRKELDEETALDIDYSTGKRLNASYRPLPRTNLQPSCSGKTSLCHEVLNDTWESFPIWSEESTYGASAKSKFEEHMYRIEDERFELDMAIQTNTYIIQVLSDVQKIISGLTDAEKCSFSIDDRLNGTSPDLNFRFIHRIYGDRTKELMEGLKRNPVVAVPIVLNRLRIREREWKEVQEKYNAVWAEQTKRYYLKSLDNRGINFKQIDSRNLRPKFLINEIETAYDEQKQKLALGSARKCPCIQIPSLDFEVYEDAMNLILQDIRRQSGISRDDRRYMADVLYFFISGFFKIQPSEVCTYSVRTEVGKNSGHGSALDYFDDSNGNSAKDHNSDDDDDFSLDKEVICANMGKKMFAHLGVAQEKLQLFKALEKKFIQSVFYVSSNWYIFFRYLAIFMTRLASLYQESLKLQNKMQQGCASTSKSDFTSPYEAMLNKMSLLLSGKMDSSRFEDEMRELFTISAYQSYTFDKVIHGIVKQLHLITSDDISRQCMALYVQHVFRLNDIASNSSLLDSGHMYGNKVVRMIGEDNCYKIMWHQSIKTLTFELLDPAKDFTEEPLDVEMSDYLDNYIDPNHVDLSLPYSTTQLTVYLKRNLRKQKEHWKKIGEFYLCSDARNYRRRNFSSRNYVPQRVIKRKLSDSDSGISSKVPRLHAPEKNGSKDFVFAKPKNVPVDSNSELRCVNTYSSMQSSLNAEIIPQASEMKMILPQDLSMTSDQICPNYEQYTEFVELAADEEEEDSIAVSAEDLFLHLAETGMTVFENFRDPFVATVCSPKFENQPSAGLQEKTNIIATEERLSGDTLNKFDPDKNVPYDKNVAEASVVDENQAQNTSDGIKLCMITQSEVPVGVFKVSDPNILNFTELENTEIMISEEPSELIVEPESNQIALPCENEVIFIDPNNPFSYQDEINGNNLMLASECVISQEETIFEDDDPDDAVVITDPVIRKKVDMLEFGESKRHGSYEEIYRDSNSESFEDMSSQMSIQNLIIRDNLKCTFDFKTYKMRFAVGSFDLIYRIGSFAKSKKVHRAVSLKRSEKFSSWLRSWVDRSITPSMLKLCHDWLFRSDFDKFRIECVTMNDKSKPPYSPYSKYRVRTYRRPRRR